MALMDIEAGFWSIRRQLETLLGSKQANVILQQAGANGGASFAASLGAAADVKEQGCLFEYCVQAYQRAGFGQFEIHLSDWLMGHVVIQARNTIEAWMLQRHGQLAEEPVCAYSSGVLVGFINVVSRRRDIVCIEHHCEALGDPCCEFELLPAMKSTGQTVIAFTPDPALGTTANLPPMFTEPQVRQTLERLVESESLLRSVIENAHHFAIYRLILDPENPYGARVALVSPSMKEFAGVEDPYDFSNWFKNLHPEDISRVLQANRRSLAEGLPYNQVARIYNPRQDRWLWVQTISNPGYDAKGRLTHFDGMVIDLTEQKEAELALQQVNATLEERVRERTEEIERRQEAAESLRDIISMINSNMPLADFLQQAVEMAAQQLGAAACVLHHLDLENKIVTRVACYGMDGIFPPGSRLTFSDLKPWGGEDYLFATIQKQPTYGNYPPLPERVDEILRDPTIPEEIKAERIALRERFAGSFSVPLFIQGNIYGGMVFYYTKPQEFQQEQIQLGLTFADQVAVAIENARLFQEAEQKRSVAESLRDTLSILNTEQPLSQVLHHIVAQAQNLLNAKAVAIYKLNSQERMLSPQSSVGLSDEYVENIRLPVGQGALGQAILKQKPILVNDATSVFEGRSLKTIDGEAIVLGDELISSLRRFSDRYGGVLAVPMKVKTQVYGGLVLYYEIPRNIQPEEVQLAVTFANQASLAIENALLQEQAAEAAVLTERNRLARDLHDAVSQTLFSASLIAEVLPKLWERNPGTAQQKLEELRQLTRGALSEMRTLLLELRPTSLSDMDLSDLLRHLANAFISRERIPIELIFDGMMDPPAEVKAVFYRVVQEALNNIGKHAEASQVTIHLVRQEVQIVLEVYDNGGGFDPQQVNSTGLGLGIMRERAETIGAQLEISSLLGHGTCISLVWQADNQVMKQTGK